MTGTRDRTYGNRNRDGGLDRGECRCDSGRGSVRGSVGSRGTSVDVRGGVRVTCGSHSSLTECHRSSCESKIRISKIAF